jgi:hypothetical protein
MKGTRSNPNGKGNQVMKRIHIETLGDKTAKVYLDSDWGEFRVRLYIRGELHAPADYHTSDKADAIATAAAMVRADTRQDAHPLSIPFNVAVLHIAAKVLPCGFDVSEIAPQTFDSLMAHYEATGRVLAWKGTSEKTVFADTEVSYAFQAWHNSKYILGGFPFTPQGEQAAMCSQIADIRTIYDGAMADSFCAMIKAEIQGTGEAT